MQIYSVKYNLSIRQWESFSYVKNVNDHLDALNIDDVDNRNIDGNCLNNRGLHLNRTKYGKLAINLVKK